MPAHPRPSRARRSRGRPLQARGRIDVQVPHRHRHRRTRAAEDPPWRHLGAEVSTTGTRTDTGPAQVPAGRHRSCRGGRRDLSAASKYVPGHSTPQEPSAAKDKDAHPCDHCASPGIRVQRGGHPQGSRRPEPTAEIRQPYRSAGSVTCPANVRRRHRVPPRGSDDRQGGNQRPSCGREFPPGDAHIYGVHATSRCAT